MDINALPDFQLLGTVGNILIVVAITITLVLVLIINLND